MPPHATVGVGGGAPCYKQGGVPFLPHPRQGLLMVILQLACPQATCPPSTFASGQRSDPHANGSGGRGWLLYGGNVRTAHGTACALFLALLEGFSVISGWQGRSGLRA